MKDLDLHLVVRFKPVSAGYSVSREYVLSVLFLPDTEL